MISVSLAGIGGQGSVLAAKILAEAARAKGWQVRTAETTGMAQRGGDVTSHVRMAEEGEAVYSPLPSRGSDDAIIALEPGEGLRCLPYLKRDGVLVVAASGVAPVVADFKAAPYDPEAMIAALRASGATVIVVDDEALTQAAGSRKSLNIVMLATALCAINDPSLANPACGKITLDDMRAAIGACVKPRFVEMNLRAVQAAEETYRAG